MRIAVDAMGGDYAPQEIMKGAFQAMEEGLAQVILVGDENIILDFASDYGYNKSIEVVHAPQVIKMDESPANALRRKRHSSIAVTTNLVKEGKADGMVSAGSTGAQMAAALLGLGRIKGIQRPAICSLLPTLIGPRVMLDVGANVDCKPNNLVQFAIMGSIYAERVLRIKEPSVGLLNIGTEESKGNELTLAAYHLLKDAPINFIGNVEAREMTSGATDVIVCDGFVGNSLLKFGEGIGQAVFSMLEKELQGNLRAKLGAGLMLPAFKNIKLKMDYAEYGGAPLLGVQGVSLVCHGSSKANAIKNAVKAAVNCVKSDFVKTIAAKVQTEGVEIK